MESEICILLLFLRRQIHAYKYLINKNKIRDKSGKASLFISLSNKSQNRYWVNKKLILISVYKTLRMRIFIHQNFKISSA